MSFARINCFGALAFLLAACQTDGSISVDSSSDSVVVKPTVIKFESCNAPPPKHWYAIYDGSYRRDCVTISGALMIPEGANGEVPAVVIMHDSAGIQHNHEFAWAKMLNDIGIAAFIVDSFSSRGTVSTVFNQDKVTNFSMTVDAYRALTLLAEHPQIDKNKIALIGFSKGGAVAYLAAWEWFREHLARNNLRFAAFIPVYADCTIHEETVRLSRAPMLFLGGTLDNWTTIERCEMFAKRARQRGYDVEVVTYKAKHAFDNPSIPDGYSPGAGNWSDCLYYVNYYKPNSGFRAEGRSSWEQWGRWGAYERTCFKNGASWGYSGEATKKAREDVALFLNKVFGLMRTDDEVQ